MRPLLWLLLLTAMLVAGASGEPKVVIEWTFDQPGHLQGWQPNTHLKDARVADGLLTAEAINWDPYFTSPGFSFAATPYQQVELRIRSDRPFAGQLFWTNKFEGKYAGFEPNQNTPFRVAGGGQWQTVTIRPFWQTQKKIVQMRLDLAEGCEVAVDWLRVVDLSGAEPPDTKTAWTFADGPAGWRVNGLGAPRQAGRAISMMVEDPTGTFESPALDLPVGDRLWVVVRMKADRGQRARLLWAGDAVSGLASQTFDLRADGRFHDYNLDVGGHREWQGRLLLLGLQPSTEAGARVEIESLALSTDPTGAPDLAVLYFGLEDAVNRAGRPARVVAKVINHGGETAAGVAARLGLPDGLTATPDPAAGEPSPACEFELPATFRWRLTAPRPMTVRATLKLTGPGAPPEPVTAELTFTEPCPAEPTDYVPAPRPAATDYQIGSYYFPRWYRAIDWECIDRVAPIRKPVLGWYDERSPEIVDWQIKWAVEHGVSYFLVDWYWDRGSRHLEHWLNEGFARAKYRRYLNWCVMWANHNAQGSHADPQDWTAVTQYWLDHCFKQPEYLKQGGRPVVWIWAPFNISRDVGGIAQAKALLDQSQAMARAAGYPGIVFGAMNAGGSEREAKDLAAMGYTLNSSYHWWGDAPARAKDPQNFSFELVADSAAATWRERETIVEAAGLKWVPVADTGWDSRPWHGDRARVISGRTAPLFERILRDAKAYLDERGEKSLILGPWNEWGEGSYLEPCAEYGFDLLRAVRRVFTTAPEARTDLTPVDVGLGPYDLPLIAPAATGQWEFAQDAGGWAPMMGITRFELADGAVHLITGSTDPALSVGGFQLPAGRNGYFAIRLKATGPAAKDGLQLFFSTPTLVISEANSVRTEVICDGAWRTYVIPVKANPRWRGVIQSLRLDPGSVKGADWWIDWIRFSSDQPAP